jgi:hypothetical protein
VLVRVQNCRLMPMVGLVCMVDADTSLRAKFAYERAFLVGASVPVSPVALSPAFIWLKVLIILAHDKLDI